MNTTELETTARYLVQHGRGILAADESAATCNKRFEPLGIESTEENRRIYRQILLTTPSAKESLSGVIFFDETFWQKSDDLPAMPAHAGQTGGKPFHQMLAEMGILPGIKVDEGLVDLPGFPGEKISKGLDTLPDRMATYRDAGAKFAKWRSVITIAESTPTDEAIAANAFVLARYARICQENDIVPIVEPEVLFDGIHTIEQCEAVMVRVYKELFATLTRYRVHLPGVILKTSMVLPGKESGFPLDPDDVSTSTVRVLHEHVPKELGGVVFLSGGQTPSQAFLNLNAIAAKGPHPWGLTFSFSRGLQDPVLKHWAAHREDIAGAKEIFARQLAIAVDATKGTLHTASLGGDFVSGSQDL